MTEAGRAEKPASAAARSLTISPVDYWMARFCFRSPGLMKWLAHLETTAIGDRLNERADQTPIYISGLARAGTTVLLEQLAGLPGMASHQYRDFPWIMTPVIWNGYLDRFAPRASEKLQERPHQDGIRISPQSPEAFEEPIWQAFFPHVHRWDRSHVLREEDVNPQFDAAYRNQLRKMLYLRRGTRYLAKANYHLVRIEYILRLFPGARFIVPVRNPLAHIASLMRQHQLFTDYARAEPRVPGYLVAAGHFEFGPQRVPTLVNAEDGERIRSAWSTGAEATGYAIQWATLYRYVIELCRDKHNVEKSILVVRHEDLCTTPKKTFDRIGRFCDLNAEQLSVLHERGKQFQAKPPSRTGAEIEASSLPEELRSVARMLGYQI